MIELNTQTVSLYGEYSQPRNASEATREALRLYNRSRSGRMLTRLRAALGRGAGGLAGLHDGSSHSGHYLGTRTVPIGNIRGSEGRTTDFDADFHPLNEAGRNRWVSVATARLRGVALPRVSLIQVGEAYYVRDGHHRISVARALGEDFIDADVIAWEA